MGLYASYMCEFSTELIFSQPKKKTGKMNLSVPFWSSELIHEFFAKFLKEQVTQKLGF